MTRGRDEKIVIDGIIIFAVVKGKQIAETRRIHGIGKGFHALGGMEGIDKGLFATSFVAFAFQNSVQTKGDIGPSAGNTAQIPRIVFSAAATAFLFARG